MENASKALLIAAAILLAIILISMGLFAINQGRNSLDKANLASEEAQAFNSKISIYCGQNKTAATMNSLMDAIAASNGAQRGLSEQHFISVTFSGTVNGASSTTDVSYNNSTTSATYPSFSNSNTYTATYSVDNSGYINTITISN